MHMHVFTYARAHAHTYTLTSVVSHNSAHNNSFVMGSVLHCIRLITHVIQFLLLGAFVVGMEGCGVTKFVWKIKDGAHI